MQGGTIHTIKQNCRRCYSCVRECPAKAIRIVDGQAFVVSERCIGCGNCTVVCSQNAKAYTSELAEVQALLASGRPTVALVAPSVVADEMAREPARLIGALRQLGFARVIEVAHGAELVGRAYRAEIASAGDRLRIASACPAVVEYVRKYNPALVPALVPVVSPMIATALSVRHRYGDDVACVFVGPCVAKKVEARDPELPRVVEQVLTFDEVRRWLDEREIEIGRCEPSEYDPPHAGLGRAFPLVGGLLKSAGIERGVLTPDVMVVSGHQETLESLNDIEPDEPERLFIEALMCRGCYMGPGLSGDSRRIARRRRVTEHVRTESSAEPGAGALGADTALPFSLERTFSADDQRLEEPTESKIRLILARTNKFSKEDELNCGACGYSSCRAKAVAVHCGLAEESMCLPFILEEAERVCHELKVPWSDLRDIHQRLLNTEKLASMGQMAAGVAHELNNPLGTILLYTSILSRKLDQRPELGHDLELLVSEAQRCKKIISSLLDFARQNRVRLKTVRVTELFARAVAETQFVRESAGERVSVELSADPELEIDVDPDQMGQVLVNLVKNGIEAMDGRRGTVRLRAVVADDPGRVRLHVSDEGRGIPVEAKERVFQPFFTTKSMGQGTGLGLPIVYGIVKMHRGNVWFDTEVGRGTTFIVEIPRRQSLSRSLPE